MIDLQLLSGLPLKFDEISEKITFGEGVVCSQINHVPITSLLPCLLNKAVRYPEKVYLEHRNIHHVDHDDIFKDDKLHFDILMIPSGLMGVEFIRSHIYYSELNDEGRSGLSEIVEVVSGTLTVLLQRNKPKESDFEFDTRVSEGHVVKLNKGEKFYIPKGYYYTFINARSKPVVFSRFYLVGSIIDYTRFKREQGLAYFAIRKNAKQEIVLNPRYRDIPKIRKTQPQQINSSWGFSLDNAPLYQQIISRGPELNQFLV